MARPAKQGMDYFPHDTDAASDEKVESLRILYGNDGYAFYFILLERIYRTAAFELDVSDAETRQILARKVEVTPQKFDDMLASALKRGCFDAQSYDERKVLTSAGIKKRAENVVGKRQKMAAAYSNRVSAAENGEETPPETPQRKVKERKVNTSDDVASPSATSSPLPAPNPGKALAVATTNPDDEQHWSVGPLTKSKPFRVICERLGFLELDFEHYRRQALVSAEDGNISRTIAQWTSWIRNYLNNQSKNGPLLKAAVVDLSKPTPKHEMPPEGSDCTGRHIVLQNTGDHSMNLIYAASIIKGYPNATIHHTIR